MQNLIVYLIALPLFSSAILLLAGRRVDKWGHLLATVVSITTFVIGGVEFFAMKSRTNGDRGITQTLFDWINVGSFHVTAALLLDRSEEHTSELQSH